MSRMLYIPYAILLVFFLFLGVMFAVQNPTEVPLELFGYSFAADSVSRWVLAALTIGALLGIFLSLPMVWNANGRASRLQKRLESCQKELDKLRTTPFNER